MRRTAGSVRWLAATTGALALAACEGGPTDDWVVVVPGTIEPDSSVRIAGTVRHMEVEGGVYVIRGADGTNHNPTNLPEAFRADGMEVEADVRPRDELSSIQMVGPMIEVLRIREHPLDDAVPAGTAGGDANVALWRTAWRLENLGGAGVLDTVEATLEFPEPGRVAGNASCNQFFGEVEVSGDSVAFGPLGSTRMACTSEAVNDQETRYLAALADAVRFEINAPYLLIYSADLEESLRFVRTDP